MKYLDERAVNIRKLTEGAERDRKDAERYFETSRQELRSAKEKAVSLIESAIREADKEKLKTMGEAKKEALAIIERAELDIKKGIEKAKDDVKKRYCITFSRDSKENSWPRNKRKRPRKTD